MKIRDFIFHKKTIFEYQKVVYVGLTAENISHRSELNQHRDETKKLRAKITGLEKDVQKVGAAGLKDAAQNGGDIAMKTKHQSEERKLREKIADLEKEAAGQEMKIKMQGVLETWNGKVQGLQKMYFKERATHWRLHSL